MCQARLRLREDQSYFYETDPLNLRPKIMLEVSMVNVFGRLNTCALGIALSMTLAACSAQGYANSFSAPIGAPPATSASAESTTPPLPETAPVPLPFKGRLLDGNPRALPPAVAASLSDSSNIVFNYREELSHDH